MKSVKECVEPDRRRRTRQLLAFKAQYNSRCRRLLIASGSKECRRSFEVENETVKSVEDSVVPRGVVELDSCLHVERNAIFSVAGHWLQVVQRMS